MVVIALVAAPPNGGHLACVLPILTRDLARTVERAPSQMPDGEETSSSLGMRLRSLPPTASAGTSAGIKVGT